MGRGFTAFPAVPIYPVGTTVVLATAKLPDRSASKSRVFRTIFSTPSKSGWEKVYTSR
jgi:hypothetical protein